MKFMHLIRISPGTKVMLCRDWVVPIPGIVTRVVTTYRVDEWGKAEEGLTKMTVQSSIGTVVQTFEHVTFDELVDHDGKWQNVPIEVEGLSGNAKPGASHGGVTVRRVVFRVIADKDVLNGTIYTAGHCYVDTADKTMQYREFDQFGI